MVGFFDGESDGMMLMEGALLAKITLVLTMMSVPASDDKYTPRVTAATATQTSTTKKRIFVLVCFHHGSSGSASAIWSGTG
mmetsp:Transcript_38637/g.66001  ORF Transcript_38637/g.66001 Transcript_38637/m.66001 type:complete len:81 (-) Transcript_38637:810-1052(-)